MDFTASKNDLVRILSRAANVAATKPGIAALGMTHLVANEVDGTITARATDLFIGVETFAPAGVTIEGSICVPARRAAEIIKSLPSGDIRVRIMKTHVEVSSGKSKMKLDFIPGGEFPKIPKLPAGYATSSVAGVEFGRALAQGSFAMLADDSKPDQHASLIEAEGGILRVASAQNKYMAWADCKYNGQSMDRETPMIVPFRGVGELRRLCEIAKDGDVAFANYEGVGFFAVGEVTLSCKLVDTKFLPYRKVIPTKNEHDITIHRETLVDSIKRTVIALEKATVGALLTFTDGQLTVTTERDGDCEDVIECNSIGDFSVAVNPRCILDALEAARDDEIRIGFNTSKRGPVYFKTDECSSLVMPLVRT